ncbi:MAG: TIM barrel protein [Caldilineaceae bacterium]
MTRFGLPREALLKHHARLQITPIVRQLEAIDHPSVGMTLDIAHLHIAAHDMGFDYLDAVAEAAPWVVHLHANDNYGRLDTGFDSEPERWPYGEADIHLPRLGINPLHRSLRAPARLPRRSDFGNQRRLRRLPGREPDDDGEVGGFVDQKPARSSRPWRLTIRMRRASTSMRSRRCNSLRERLTTSRTVPSAAASSAPLHSRARAGCPLLWARMNAASRPLTERKKVDRSA